MSNEFEQKMMLKFLQLNYPVARIKLKHNFKRAIVLDDNSVYILSDKNHRTQLIFLLNKILCKVFNCDEAIGQDVLKNFLQLT